MPQSDIAPVSDRPLARLAAECLRSGGYLSDGISEDIITALSKLPKLFVVARNSTFTYKGKAVDVKRVGREQGVRYVLEGSVRHAGGRLRITAQLVDATTGHHIWAERYDRVVEDVCDRPRRRYAVLCDSASSRLPCRGRRATTLLPWLKRIRSGSIPITVRGYFRIAVK